jgi:hypothetical protein
MLLLLLLPQLVSACPCCSQLALQQQMQQQQPPALLLLLPVWGVACSPLHPHHACTNKSRDDTCKKKVSSLKASEPSKARCLLVALIRRSHPKQPTTQIVAQLKPSNNTSIQHTIEPLNERTGIHKWLLRKQMLPTYKQQFSSPGLPCGPGPQQGLLSLRVLR